LINHEVLPQIIEAASLNLADTVIEIGPGKGVLTEQLCQRAGRVIAIEIDEDLIPGLMILQKKYSNLEIHHADFNQFNWQELVKSTSYKIVANIPYHVTGLIFRTIFNPAIIMPSMAVLMIQYEVAKKIVPKKSNRTILSNLIESFGTPNIVAKVDKKSFRPVPKVDSAILAVYDIHKPSVDNFDQFFRLVKIGFAARRKTLVNNLSNGLQISKDKVVKILAECGIDADRRAQTLSIDEWKKLYYKLEK
jgi:16S rRNA (adenine1518-N6/adenine1519-N6)-dimethyltransferase